MSSTKRSLLAIALVFAFSLIAAAQDRKPETTLAETPPVTLSANAERIRISAPSAVVQLRLEIYDEAGHKIFDTEQRGGSVLDWHLQSGEGERVAAGAYVCVVTIKSLTGRLSQKLGRVEVGDRQASAQAFDAGQLSGAQSQVIGPVEDNESLSVVADGLPPATAVMHTGDEGQVTRTRGALTFRVGDFFSGADREQMRLTEEGYLGIGTSKPKFNLDVAGAIRARQGFVFNDGSMLNVNDKGMLTRSAADGSLTVNVAGTGTQGRLARWVDDSGTLGDSIVFDNKGFLGIGTSSPDSLLTVQGTIPSLLGKMAVFRTTGTNNGFGLQMDATGPGNNAIGLAVNGTPKAGFAWDNARQFIGFVNFAYAPNDFALRVNVDGSLTYHDGLTSAELFRITKNGNVGVGTNNPATKLHVAGNVNFTGLRTEGTPSTPNVIGGSTGNTVSPGVFAATIGGGGEDGGQGFFLGNKVFDNFGVIGGGRANTVGTDNGIADRTFATIGGGSDNDATGQSSTIGGGFFNRAQGEAATIGGGTNNRSNGQRSTVGGGTANEATAEEATISGGGGNTASGLRSTVPGGVLNTAAGEHSFAAGRRAKANHNGAWVWADSTDADFASTAANQFLIRAAGGVGIGTTNPVRLLTVNGRARIANIPAEAAVGPVCFNASGDLLQCGASSLRYKTNITPFTGGLLIVNRLRPITFDWKNGEGRDIGLGAEEVARIAPQFTFADEAGKVEGVKYDRIPVLLINAIQEQQQQIAQLRRAIGVLQRQNAHLSRRRHTPRRKR